MADVRKFRNYLLAFERSSKNIYLKLSVRLGSFEILDDGESIDLKELNENSALVKRNLLWFDQIMMVSCPRNAANLFFCYNFKK